MTEKEKKTTDAASITFSGPVTFNGPMFDIHDNQHVELHTQYAPPPPATPSEQRIKEEKSDNRPDASPGRPKTPIFNDHVNVVELAAAVKSIHDAHYNPTSRRIEIGDDSFDETDFLLCLYYVLVERGDSPSTLANKTYYAFLTEACGIRPQASEKTFGNHLNKVVRTGKDFHRLTPDLLAKGQQSGAMRPDELPHWQRMFEVAERVMEQNYFST